MSPALMFFISAICFLLALIPANNTIALQNERIEKLVQDSCNNSKYKDSFLKANTILIKTQKFIDLYCITPNIDYNEYIRNTTK